MASLQRLMPIDDDTTILQITEIALQSVAKLEICACESGLMAVEQVASFKPQLILLDVQMPGLNGRDTLKRLAQVIDISEIAVVFMTASKDQSEANALRDLGAFDVIQKPFDPLQLPVTIRDIWQAWKAKKGK